MDRGFETSSLPESLSDLSSSADFRKLDRQFDRFCPFEAVGMVRAEIRHSNFLGYVINPYRPHGFRIALLKAFITSAFGHSVSTEINDEALQTAEIRREWRNIDLLVLLPKAKQIVAVELKIDASQSVDQLERYRKIVESTWPASEGWNHKYLFLTKHDEKPNDEFWREFKLLDLVNEFAQVANDESYHDAQGLDMLRSYIQMMRRHHLGDKDTEDLARELWSKHGEALAFLMDHRPDPLQEVFNQIRDENAAFIEAISHPGVTVVEDVHIKRILRYAFAEWDGLTSFQTARNWTSTNRLILLEIQLQQDQIRAFLMLGPGTTKHREEYAAALQPTKRTKYIPLDEENLVSLDAANDISFVNAEETMASFTKRVFGRFNPIMERTSNALKLGSELNSQ